MSPHDWLFHLIKSGGPYQVTRFAYVSGTTNVEYIGIADRGSASSDAAWQIFKLTYSGTSVTLIESSLKNQVWDNRTTVTYA